MKISKAILLYSFVIFPFEMSSPYLEKFDEILHRILESGILKSHQHSADQRDKFFNTQLENVKGESGMPESLSLSLLLIVIFTGYFLSFSVHLIEVLIGYRKRNLSKKRTYGRRKVRNVLSLYLHY